MEEFKQDEILVCDSKEMHDEAWLYALKHNVSMGIKSDMRITRFSKDHSSDSGYHTYNHICYDDSTGLGGCRSETFDYIPITLSEFKKKCREHNLKERFEIIESIKI